MENQVIDQEVIMEAEEAVEATSNGNRNLFVAGGAIVIGLAIGALAYKGVKFLKKKIAEKKATQNETEETEESVENSDEE